MCLGVLFWQMEGGLVTPFPISTLQDGPYGLVSSLEGGWENFLSEDALCWAGGHRPHAFGPYFWWMHSGVLALEVACVWSPTGLSSGGLRLTSGPSSPHVDQEVVSLRMGPVCMRSCPAWPLTHEVSLCSLP